MTTKEDKEILVIDAENATAGRLASYTAKQVLMGKEIAIINSEKAIITGREQNISNKYLTLRRKGGSAIKGPFFPSNPERILKRMIRGMLPRKKLRGIEAMKRVKCYVGVPKEFEGKNKIKSGKEKTTTRSITIKQLSKKLKNKE